MTHHVARMLAALLVAVVLIPTAARAERVVMEDATEDALSYTIRYPSGDETDLAVSPDETSTDIVRSVVAYGERRLVVSVRFRDLVRTKVHATSLRIVTPSRELDLTAEKAPGRRAETYFHSGRKEVTCRTVRARFDQSTDVVRMALPSACIDAPRWVRIGVGAIGRDPAADSEEPSTLQWFLDDGHRVGEVRRGRPVLGPRIRRG